MVDWNKPLEAVLEDGTTVPVKLAEAMDDGDYAIVPDPSVGYECYRPDGRCWIDPEEPVYIRNVVEDIRAASRRADDEGRTMAGHTTITITSDDIEVDPRTEEGLDTEIVLKIGTESVTLDRNAMFMLSETLAVMWNDQMMDKQPDTPNGFTR